LLFTHLGRFLWIFPRLIAGFADEQPKAKMMTFLALGYAVALLVALLIADSGALAPMGEYINSYPLLDELVHFLMYGSLALLTNAALATRRRGSLSRAIATGTIIVLVAATAEELSNLFVPYRGWAVSDLAANYLGIVIVGVVPLAYLPAQFARLKQSAAETDDDCSGANGG
jgi:VanZ family protein